MCVVGGGGGGWEERTSPKVSKWAWLLPLSRIYSKGSGRTELLWHTHTRINKTLLVCPTSIGAWAVRAADTDWKGRDYGYWAKRSRSIDAPDFTGTIYSCTERWSPLTAAEVYCSSGLFFLFSSFLFFLDKLCYPMKRLQPWTTSLPLKRLITLTLEQGRLFNPPVSSRKYSQQMLLPVYSVFHLCTHTHLHALDQQRSHVTFICGTSPCFRLFSPDSL